MTSNLRSRLRGAAVIVAIVWIAALLAPHEVLAAHKPPAKRPPPQTRHPPRNKSPPPPPKALKPPPVKSPPLVTKKSPPPPKSRSPPAPRPVSCPYCFQINITSYTNAWDPNAACKAAMKLVIIDLAKALDKYDVKVDKAFVPDAGICTRGVGRVCGSMVDRGRQDDDFVRMVQRGFSARWLFDFVNRPNCPDLMTNSLGDKVFFKVGDYYPEEDLSDSRCRMGMEVSYGNCFYSVA